MASKKEERALAPIQEKFVALQGAEHVAEVIKENLGVMEVSMFDLERIVIPSGAGDLTHFTVTDSKGNPNMVKELDVVIAYFRDIKTLWLKAFGDGDANSPPDCSSDDGITGIGIRKEGDTEPSQQSCATCPHNQFGSGHKGNGKLCRQSRVLFCLRMDKPESFLPSVVMITPGSLKSASEYFIMLSGLAKVYCSVVTRLSLMETTNNDSISYAQLVMRRGDEEVTGADLKSIRSYQAGLKTMFSNIAADIQKVDVVGG